MGDILLGAAIGIVATSLLMIPWFGVVQRDWRDQKKGHRRRRNGRKE